MGLKSKKKQRIIVNDMGSSSMMDRSEQRYEIDSQGLKFGRKNIIDMVSSDDESQMTASVKQAIIDDSISQTFDGSIKM